jgi:hypothetical protein
MTGPIGTPNGFGLCSADAGIFDMLIDKNDPRLAAAALACADDEQLIGVPLRRFIVPGRGGTADVLIKGDGQLDLQPERSSAHRALCVALGINS